MKSQRVGVAKTVMADFVGTLLEMRNGAIAIEANEALTRVVQAVMRNRKRGKLTVSLTIAPSRLEDGEVKEVDIVHDITFKEPRRDPGKSIFFPCADGRLSRVDPAQREMFEDQEGEE